MRDNRPYKYVHVYKSDEILIFFVFVLFYILNHLITSINKSAAIASYST